MAARSSPHIKWQIIPIRANMQLSERRKDFATIDEALRAGASRFGLQSFLVRRAGEKEETVSVPALTLGLISANS